MASNELGDHPSDMVATGEPLNLTPEQTACVADQIRKQVDFWFSVENLCRDKHLLGKMKGRKNRPVPLAVICSFNKLKNCGSVNFIAEALQSSESVNVVDVDGKLHIQRKTPFIKDEHLDKWDAAPMQRSGNKPIIMPIRSRKGVTGFEEYYADPPITPMEFEEEQDMYSPDKHFAERIETALQRFEAKRKMHNDVRNIFTKWVMYGGVDNRPKPFGSVLDKEFLETHNAQEIAQATSSLHVSDDKYLDRKDAVWEVSFERVARGFLSTVMQDYFELETLDKVQRCTNVLINFYNYILHHNVCPEYAADVYAARRVCQYGAQEVYATIKLARSLPGEFNMACSVLFDGSQKAQLSVNEPWNLDSEKKQDSTVQRKHFAEIFSQGITFINQQQGSKLDTTSDSYTAVVDQMDIGLEVVTVELPHTAQDQPDNKSADNLGKLICQTWRIPTFETDDLPPGAAPVIRDETYTFWMETSLLEWFADGMKLLADIYIFEDAKGNQIPFFDTVRGVFCSFYTPLENELIKGWKVPRWVAREELWEREKQTRNSRDGDGERDENAVDD